MKIVLLTIAVTFIFLTGGIAAEFLGNIINNE